MEIEPSPRFNRDIRRVGNADLRRRVSRAIETLETASTISEIPGIAKVRSARGHHYRIRIGNYRLGITLEGDVVMLFRFLHRSELHRRFP